MSKTILAIETSSTICSTAIIEDDKILNSVEGICPRGHNEYLPGFVMKVLEKSNRKVNDLDALAVSIGPGSFTGLRIGLGFCKGLAFSNSLPIIPVPTMLSLAYSIKEQKPSSGILFSHGIKVFYQCFDWRNNTPSLIDKAIVTNFENINKEITLDFHSNCEKLFKGNTTVTSVSHSARFIAFLASKYFDEWMIKKPFDLVPDYIAPFEIKNRAKQKQYQKSKYT